MNRIGIVTDDLSNMDLQSASAFRRRLVRVLFIVESFSWLYFVGLKNLRRRSAPGFPLAEKDDLLPCEKVSQLNYPQFPTRGNLGMCRLVSQPAEG